MFCKWCGLESETNDLCSWCRKPFSSAASSVKQPPAPPAQVTHPVTTPVTPSQHAAPALTESFDDEPPPPSDFVPIVTSPPPASAPSAVTVAPTHGASGFPLGDSFDDIDDDLSPMQIGRA